MEMCFQNGISWFIWFMPAANELTRHFMPLHAYTSFLYMRVMSKRTPARFQALFEIAQGQQGYFIASLSTFKPAALASAI